MASGIAEQFDNRATFIRNMVFPRALFSLPKTIEEYRSASMAISTYGLIVTLLGMLFGALVGDYVLSSCLSVFALIAAASLIRMASLKRVDPIGLCCLAIGGFISFLFILLYVAIRPYAGRPGDGSWLAAGLLFALVWTPFFARFFFHGRKLLNNADS
jgi:hypothetical protein